MNKDQKTPDQIKLLRTENYAMNEGLEHGFDLVVNPLSESQLWGKSRQGFCSSRCLGARLLRTTPLMPLWGHQDSLVLKKRCLLRNRKLEKEMYCSRLVPTYISDADSPFRHAGRQTHVVAGSSTLHQVVVGGGIR